MTTPTYDVRAGDTLALLRELPTASVDAIITDPPYSSGGQFRGDRSQSTGTKYVNSTTAVRRLGQRRRHGRRGPRDRQRLPQPRRQRGPGRRAPAVLLRVAAGQGSRAPDPETGRRHAPAPPRRTQGGGLILDPFAGSGTTGVACALDGYSFLGFELHPHFAELARERITAAFEGRPRQHVLELEGDLFADLPAG